jgi:hypothetical protein
LRLSSSPHREGKEVEELESKTKSSPEFKPKITPEQVKERIANDKSKVATSQSEKAAAKKTPPATKEKTEKPKKAEKKKDAPLTFPASIRINNYGFIGVRKGLLEALSWKKGMALKIDKNSDGSVTVRKA